VRFFVDVDGTLTDTQCSNSFFKKDCKRWNEMIEKVTKLNDEGHEIIIWSGSTAYAQKVARALPFDVVAAIGKPEVLIDNEKRRWGKRLTGRMITPEEFLEKEY
jgi:phosphoserine phosphatase